MKGKNSPESLVEEILKLDAIEFLGICKIIGVDVYSEIDVEENVEESVEENVEGGESSENSKFNAVPRNFEDIWCDVCDTIESMNRVRRRNLGKLVYAATKKEKTKEK